MGGFTQRYAEEAQRSAEVLFWNADYTDLAEARGFSTVLFWGCGTEIRRGARRNTKVLFWNADLTDLTEAHGFFNCVVFNNYVENLRITTDLWPLRDHSVFADDTYNSLNSLNSMINIIKSSNYTD